MKTYAKTAAFWNTRFDALSPHKFTSERYGNPDLDHALDWVRKDADAFLDFGCAPGTILALLALKGPGLFHGIDLSETGIALAKKTFNENALSGGHFTQGGVEALTQIKSATYDAVILSNVIDNLTPTDAETVLNETVRVLKPKGKVFLKLNDYRDANALHAHNTKKLPAAELYLEQDGLYLLNRTTDAWLKRLEQDFTLETVTTIVFKPHNVQNRLFLLRKK